MTDTPRAEAPFALAQLAPRRNRRSLLVGALIAALVAVAALGGVILWQANRSFTVTGSIVLPQENYEASTTCWGRGTFSDIAGGAQVTVSDAKGATIALGRLTAGRLAGNGTCTFDFRVADIPAGKDFYGVEIALRGIVRFSEAQMTAGPLQLGLK